MVRQTPRNPTQHRPMRVCSVSGCPNLYPREQGTRCTTHRKEADKARGTATQRGYTSKGHQQFRSATLNRNPICVLCHIRQATVADHYPHSRKELIELGLNPNDPEYGRGLCETCHNTQTATNQPGGWHQPQGWGDTP